jgi:hypothetical protein
MRVLHTETTVILSLNLTSCRTRVAVIWRSSFLPILRAMAHVQVIHLTTEAKIGSSS